MLQTSDELMLELKRRLGYPVISIAVEDEVIESLIKRAYMKVAQYSGETVIVTGMPPVVNLAAYKPLAVLRVYDAVKGITSLVGELDEFYMINYAKVANAQDLSNILVQNLYRSTMREAFNKGYKLVEDKLYISGYYSEVSIEMVTEQDVADLDPAYEDWAFEYALALLKEVEGEIRSKITIDGSPFSLNGQALKSEGVQKQSELISKLGNDMGLFYVTR